MELITENAEETKKLGKKLAASLASKEGPQIFALTGDLGSGKTTFVQGFAEGFGIKNIISPTFILMKKYELKKRGNEELKNLYHLDLYRLETNVEREVRNFGIEEIWNDPENIVIIEWGEKIKDMIPKSAVWISFENLSEDERKINIS